MDGLGAHKSSLIMDIIEQHHNLHVFFTPAHTPEFSPIGNTNYFSLSLIENMFGLIKKQLKDYKFQRNLKKYSKFR